MELVKVVSFLSFHFVVLSAIHLPSKRFFYSDILTFTTGNVIALSYYFVQLVFAIFSDIT